MQILNPAYGVFSANLAEITLSSWKVCVTENLFTGNFIGSFTPRGICCCKSSPVMWRKVDIKDTTSLYDHSPSSNISNWKQSFIMSNVLNLFFWCFACFRYTSEENKNVVLDDCINPCCQIQITALKEFIACAVFMWHLLFVGLKSKILEELILNAAMCSCL